MNEDTDPTDPYERMAQTFPILKPSQIQRMLSFGTVIRMPKGATLFERGQRRVNFYLVLKGNIEFFEFDQHGNERVFVSAKEGQFSGELGHFNRRKVLVSARTSEDSELLQIRPMHFRRMMTSEAELAEVIMRAFILRRVGLIRHEIGGVVIVGKQKDSCSLELRQFLSRNGYPFAFREYSNEETDIDEKKLPVVIIPSSPPMYQPTKLKLAKKLGLYEILPREHKFDVAVIGAGPGGLAAAVYSASEGLDTIILETLAPGGQAGTSSKIENYLGFPNGISGQALAGRATVQAQKFGARLAISREVTGIEFSNDGCFTLYTEDHSSICAKSVVIATGARYRKLNLSELEKFEGYGIHYAATAMESQLCIGEEVIIVGGGNSAGQAAMYMSQESKMVHMLIRSKTLSDSMSDYLIKRIEASPRITIHWETEICKLKGENFLEGVTWKNTKTHEETTTSIKNVFVMIGAEPNTNWIKDFVELDVHGFIKTNSGSSFETSQKGIFAVGDVRSGSIKRVASAVGEGSVVVQMVHKYLNSLSHPELNVPLENMIPPSPEEPQLHH
jgi:thioredoxin reductase (NADPH)